MSNLWDKFWSVKRVPFDPPADLKLGALDRLDGVRLAPVSHVGSYDYARDRLFGDLEDAGVIVPAGRHKAVTA